MSQARVDSLEALERLRAAVLLFHAKTKRYLDQAIDESHHTRQWLQLDRRPYWQNQLRQRAHRLEQAEQELMSARMSEFLDSPAAQQLAVRRARTAHAEAVEKLARVQRWNRDFDHRSAAPMRKLESLRDHLSHAMPKAAAELHQAITALEAYTERNIPQPAPASPESTGNTA